MGADGHFTAPGTCRIRKERQGELVDDGQYPDIPWRRLYRRVGKKAAGRELDGRTWDEFPEVAS